MRIDFFEPMLLPKTTAQEHEIRVVKGKPIVHDTAQIKAAKTKYTAHFASHRPEAPLSGPLRLVVKMCWPIEGTKHFDGEWYVEKPDFDNAIKIPLDCLKKLGFFDRDDCQVASGIVEKFWARVPGIFVSIEELT